MFLRHIPKKKILLLSGDASLICIALFLSRAIRFGTLDFGMVKPSLGGVFILLVYLFTLYTADLYEFDVRFKSPRYLFRFLAALSIAAALVTVVFFFFPALKFGRGIFIISAGLIAVLLYPWRLLFEWALSGFLKRQKRLLIVGSGSEGRRIYGVVKDNQNFRVVGFIDEDTPRGVVLNSPAVLGNYAVLDEMVAEHEVEAIIIALPHLTSPELLKCTLHCKMEGVQVYDMPGFYEEVAGRVPIEQVNDFWFVNTPILGVKRDIYNQHIKRTLDIIFSTVGLVLTLPVSLMAALAIKLESRGPVLYRQARVRQNDEIFYIIKFRSMGVDAEENGAVWADPNDDRVTGVGRVIRKLRVDEIPQMWNVLKGEMSFIGPRPERPEFVEVLRGKIPYYSLRHSVKPGLTGWAQVNYPYGASEKDALEKLEYDLYYVKNLSPLLEFIIFLKTVKVVLFGRGAR